MNLTLIDADSQAITLLCSALALGRDTGVEPLSATEWASLATSIHRSDLERPGALIGLDSESLGRELEISAEASRRVAALLARGGQLALELDRLAGRGIWVVTRADETYPSRLKERLKSSAPPVLFGAGRPALLLERAIAIVGSREADDRSLAFASLLARRCVEAGFAVVSGAARGVDSAAMVAAAEAGGGAVGFVADALEKMTRRQELREHLVDGNVALVSPYHPAARFTVGNAMRRNRLIYCHAQAAVVVAAAGENGGTRGGALENLKSEWTPLFVRADEGVPPGNDNLIQAGGAPLRTEDLDQPGAIESLASQPTASRALRLDDLPVDSGGGVTQNDSVAENDAFRVVWPLMAALLDRPRSEAEIASTLTLELTQARAWLKRAVTEGLAERSDRPVRYHLRSSPPPQLFVDGAG